MKDPVESLFEDICDEEIEDTTTIDEGIENSTVIETSNNKYILKIHDNIYYNSPGNFLAGPKIIDIVTNTTDIPVPEIIKYGKLDERTYYVMEYENGFHFDVDKNSFNLQLNIISEIGEYLAQLHNVDCNKEHFGWISYHESKDSIYINNKFTSFKDLLCKQSHELNDSIREGGKFSNMSDKKNRFSDCVSKIDRIVNYIQDNVDINTEKKYCHNDYKYDNIIISEDKKVKCIIDWDSPMVADPLYNVIQSELNLISKYEINNKITTDQKEKLQETFRKSYESTRDKQINFNSPIVHISDFYYNLKFMNNFAHWMRYASNKEKQKTESYLSNKIDTHFNYFILK